MVRRRATPLTLLPWLIIPLNVWVWLKWVSAEVDDMPFWMATFFGLAFIQLIAGITAIVVGIRALRATRETDGERGPGVVHILVGAFHSLGSIGGAGLGFMGWAASQMSGGAWGRPLRVKGRQLHPELREGSDWTAGPRPEVDGLDPATRRALEALWLHDAQKEHASVPAFARISWMLAAVGAPAELMDWCHRAAREEIDHARRCFALAAGYGGRSFSVEPMPELLLGGLDARDPIDALARESIADGALLEEYNADVAAACAVECREPVTRALLLQIADEERSHAEFSWALLDWLQEAHPERTRAVIEDSLRTLERVQRPTAVPAAKRALVDAADPDALLHHGRLPDARWARLWGERREQTVAALRLRLDRRPQREAA